jgi:hypothetical protein
MRGGAKMEITFPEKITE